jgi:hypothetical protein
MIAPFGFVVRMGNLIIAYEKPIKSKLVDIYNW